MYFQNNLIGLKKSVFIFPLFLFILINLSFEQAHSRTKKRKSKPQKQIQQVVAEPESISRSATGSTIDEVEIIGLRKIEKDAVLAKIKSVKGTRLNPEQIATDIKELFAMKLFSQVEAIEENANGNFKLIFKFTEKPTMNEIVFEGNSELKAEDLLTQSGIKTFEVVNHAKIREAEAKLTKYYEEKGFYLTKVDSVLEEMVAQETVRLKFKINENDKVKVKKITFVGNKKISDIDLKSDPRIFTKEAGFFSFMSSSGSFKQEAFDNDLQVLKYLYWNQGFLQVKIDRPLVSVTPDKKSIYVTYHIEEGDQYNVGEIDFSGDLLFPKSELFSSVKIKDNLVFSVDVMRKDINDLQAKYGDLGYAFTNVIPRYVFHEQEKKVDLIFEFEKGQKVYFGDIIVTGNSKTRDKVIRRELKIEEGELYNETRRRQSLENIQRLGFFDEVNFKTSTPPEKPDQLNLEIVIKERNTGQIQLTAAYGNSQGLSLGGSVVQNNFRGLGQALEARIDASKNRQDYKVSLTDPYFNDTKWSAGFDVFYLENQERIDYDIRKTGGNIRFGHPIYGDYTRAYFRYKIDKTDLFGNQYTDPQIFPLETAKGVTSSGTLTLEYDTRNDRFSPSKGIYADVSYERTGLGGDLRYQEYTSRFRYFYNLFWDVVWRNNLSYSNIQPLEKDGTVPFSETYRLGGPYTLRGFGSNSIGKRVFSQFRYDKIGDPTNTVFYKAGITEDERRKLSNLIVGGTKQVLFQTEMQFPLIKEAGLSGVFFYDIGQAQDDVISTNFLSDFGIGFRWLSPLGLLRFEWGWPLQKDEFSSDSVNFEFSIGPPF